MDLSFQLPHFLLLDLNIYALLVMFDRFISKVLILFNIVFIVLPLKERWFGISNHLKSKIMSGPLDISLKDKLEFIESLLIPAFDPDNELDSSKKRKEWMRQEAINTNWDAGVSAELIKRYGTVKSLEEAERKLEEVKAERLLEKAEENARKQGKSSIMARKNHLYLFFFHHTFVYLVFRYFSLLDFIRSTAIDSSSG